MNNFRFLPLLAALATGLCNAAAPSVDSFFRDPQITHVQMSPSGNYVAVVHMLPDGAAAVAVRDTTALDKLHVVAKSSPDEKIAAIHWINDNRIGFTFKDMRQEFIGNYEEIAADRDGSNLVHLISGNWEHSPQTVESHIKSNLLTADYAFFDVAHDGSDDILVEKYSWNNVDRRPDHSRLYRLNTRTRQLTPAMGGGQPEAALDWLTDDQDRPRIVSSRSKGRCIVSYRKADNSWIELQNADCYDAANFTPLSFDGADTLYVRAGYQGYDALFRYNLKTMTREQEPVVNAPGFDVVGSAETDRVARRTLGVHLLADAGTTVWFDAGMKADQDKVNALLPGRVNTLHCGHNCLDAPALLVVSGSDRRPPEYLLYQRASGKLFSLGSSYPQIDPKQMGMRDFLYYTARDGRKIPAYVTQPAGKADGPRPAVVLVHGGPWVRGGNWQWDDEAQFLASRGYVVIQPEFRGSTGFGAAHFRAGWKQWGGAMQDDLADAALWAVQQGWADPKRIGIMGASYGGYATLMGLIKHPDLFHCGVEWVGVTDLSLMFSSAMSDISQESRDYGLRTLLGDPDRDAALLSRNSPANRAAELKQPLLMAYGAEDRRVPIAHATRFHDAVKQHNKNVEFIVYPNEAHGWRHEDNRIAFWQRVEAFLDKNLKQAN
ncbi:MAG TPA: S9 family peptidase [Duganella sp.]|nr:S9 family peptidase [Duganella sp.]